MRNLFHQFSQAENQLTHALASSLAMDPDLARDFVHWSVGLKTSKTASLEIVQQRVPGEPEPLEEGERRSLPDACLYVPEEWCLVIESKLTARLLPDQLARHKRMVRNVFPKIEVLVITAETHPAVPPGVHHRTWEALYRWCAAEREPLTFWPSHLRDFMRLFESQLLEREVTLPGALTSFDGIPFSEAHPYNYSEAKLLLKQAMDLLRQRPRLRALGRDPLLTGRGAISGSKERLVWDLLSLAPRCEEEGKFTEWPHLTLGLHQDKVEAMLTLPNGARTRIRKALIELGKAGFLQLLSSVSNGIQKALRAEEGFVPTLLLLQRHYVARRFGVEDGRIKIDLRTIQPEPGSPVKAQPVWAEAAFDLFVGRDNINMQLQVGAEFPHANGLLRGGEAIQRIESAWLALAPLLQCFDVCDGAGEHGQGPDGCKQMTIGHLFSERPLKYGLRGDPWLWKDMETYFASTISPRSGDEFVALVHQAFKVLTGHCIDQKEFITIPKYAHGGMSSGMICPEFWRDEAIPMLLLRFKKGSGSKAEI